LHHIPRSSGLFLNQYCTETPSKSFFNSIAPSRHRRGLTIPIAAVSCHIESVLSSQAASVQRLLAEPIESSPPEQLPLELPEVAPEELPATSRDCHVNLAAHLEEFLCHGRTSVISDPRHQSGFHHHPRIFTGATGSITRRPPLTTSAGADRCLLERNLLHSGRSQAMRYVLSQGRTAPARSSSSANACACSANFHTMRSCDRAGTTNALPSRRLPYACHQPYTQVTSPTYG